MKPAARDIPSEEIRNPDGPPAFRALADDLNADGVPWSLVRDLPARSSGEMDIDLLVDPGHLEAFARVAARHHFLPMHTWGRGTHSFFVGRDDIWDMWLKLDAVTELSFGPFQTLWASDGLQELYRRQEDGPFYRLAADDGFWTLLLHCLLDKGRIDERHRIALADRCQAAKVDHALALLVSRACPDGLDAQTMLEAVRQQRWELLEQLAPDLAARWPTKGKWRGDSATLRNRLLRAATKLWLVPRRGFSVAILAPDGAGKSTLSANLRTSLFLPARLVYMGAYRTHADSAATEQRGFVGRLLRQWRRYLFGVVHQARGRIVIFDRYTFDGLLPSLRPHSSRRRVKRWILGHSLPAPDLTIILDVPAEEMFARKGEHSLEFLEHRRNDYLVLCSQIPRAVVVDGSQPADSLRREVASLIWRSYLAKNAHGSTARFPER